MMLASNAAIDSLSVAIGEAGDDGRRAGGVGTAESDSAKSYQYGVRQAMKFGGFLKDLHCSGIGDDGVAITSEWIVTPSSHLANVTW